MLSGAVDGSRRKADLVAEANKRHRLWAKKCVVDVKSSPWNPPKPSRTATVKWIVDEDVKIQQGSSFGGFAFIRPIAVAEQWSPQNWRNWHRAGGPTTRAAKP